MRIRHLVLATSALLFSASPAWAQDSAAAEALFRSARKAADQGDWITACDRFEESKRLEPAPGTVLNLARCREQLGQVASAWKNYEETAQRLKDGDDRQAFARRKARELLPDVPQLTLHPPEGDVEVVVIVRDMELSSATFGVALPFDPGPLTVIVRAQGYEDSVSQLNLEKGQELSHQLELGVPAGSAEAGAAGADDATIKDARTSSSRKTWGTALLVTGGAGALVAIGGGVWAGVELSTVKDEKNCQDGSCNQAGVDAASRGRIAVTMLSAGSALAVLGLGVGSYLLLTPTEDSALTVSPLVGGGLVSWRTAL